MAPFLMVSLGERARACAPLGNCPRLRLAALLVRVSLCVAVLAAATSAQAAFHLWEIQEVYSNADGSVQFIEMFNFSNNENFISSYKLETDSDGSFKSYTFPTSIPTEIATANKRLLIATPGFAAIANVTPDYTLPSGLFFNPNATNITISFDGSGSLLSSMGGTFPKDGALSLTQSGTATNSPTNLQGVTGFVNLGGPEPTGDYNDNNTVDAADYIVWRNTLNAAANPEGSGADGDSSGTIDAGDFTYWRERFGDTVSGLGAASSVPEPAPGILALLLSGSLGLRGRRKRPA
jgi:hypothetical protein